MKTEHKSKRTILNKDKSYWPVLAVITAFAVFAVWLAIPSTSQAEADVVVYKSPSCGCCSLWIEHLRENGLEVDIVSVVNTGKVHNRVGVPRKLGSCHTAVVGDYWVEGHVPADLVQKLMSEQPANIRGIAAPGMSIGSPGMEGPDATEYKVLAYDAVGKTNVYATRQGKTTAQRIPTGSCDAAGETSGDATRQGKTTAQTIPTDDCGT